MNSKNRKRAGAVAGLIVAVAGVGALFIKTRKRGRKRAAPTALAAIGGIAASTLTWAVMRKLRQRRLENPPVETEITGAHPIQPADTDLGEPGRNTEARLDEALQESFPSSDPVSIRIE